MISWWWLIPMMLFAAIVGAVIAGVCLMDNCPREVKKNEHSKKR